MTATTSAAKFKIFKKMHQNMTEISVWSWIRSFWIFECVVGSYLQFGSTKPLPTRPMTIKVFDTIRGAPTGPMVASESMDSHLFSVSKNSKISKNRKIDKNLDYLGQQKIKVP